MRLARARKKPINMQPHHRSGFAVSSTALCCRALLKNMNTSVTRNPWTSDNTESLDWRIA
jgi:hypothetical protein